MRNVRRDARRLMFVVMYFVPRRMSVAVKKSFFAPESHRHQTRHVKRRAGRGDRSDDPHEPA